MSNGNGKDRDPLELFIKLLAMTTAENDNQCLLAARKANQYLKNTLNSDWESFVRGKIKVEADPFLGSPTPTFKTPVHMGGSGSPMHSTPSRVYNDAAEIQGFFDKLSLRSYPKSIQDNINRIEGMFQKNGQLQFSDYDFIKRQANSRKRY